MSRLSQMFWDRLVPMYDKHADSASHNKWRDWPTHTAGASLSLVNLFRTQVLNYKQLVDDPFCLLSHSFLHSRKIFR